MSKEDQPLDFGDDDSDADDVLSLLEGSNNEALVSLDGDILDGLIEYDGFDEEARVAVGEDEERGGIGGWFVELEFSGYEDYAMMTRHPSNYSMKNADDIYPTQRHFLRLPHS